MKISVSLPVDDIAVLDRYAESQGLPSPSAAVHHAVRLLGQQGLEDDHAAAWAEWAGSGDGALWKRTAATGSAMLRGEIRLVDLDPARGSKANTRRPAIIVSNDRANASATRLAAGS